MHTGQDGLAERTEARLDLEAPRQRAQEGAEPCCAGALPRAQKGARDLVCGSVFSDKSRFVRRRCCRSQIFCLSRTAGLHRDSSSYEISGGSGSDGSCSISGSERDGSPADSPSPSDQSFLEEQCTTADTTRNGSLSSDVSVGSFAELADHTMLPPSTAFISGSVVGPAPFDVPSPLSILKAAGLVGQSPSPLSPSYATMHIFDNHPLVMSNLGTGDAPLSAVSSSDFDWSPSISIPAAETSQLGSNPAMTSSIAEEIGTVIAEAGPSRELICVRPSPPAAKSTEEPTAEEQEANRMAEANAGHRAFMQLLAADLTMPAGETPPTIEDLPSSFSVNSAFSASFADAFSQRTRLGRNDWIDWIPKPDPLADQKIEIPTYGLKHVFLRNSRRLGFGDCHTRRFFTRSPIAVMWAKRLDDSGTSAYVDALAPEHSKKHKASGVSPLGPSFITAVPEQAVCPHETEVKDPNAEWNEEITDWKAHWNRIPSNMHPTDRKSLKTGCMPIRLRDTGTDRHTFGLRAVQLTIPHNIFVDTCIPWPRVRDRLLAALVGGHIDPFSFKKETFFPSGLAGEASPQIIIHGNDFFDPEAWEIKPQWCKRYSFLIDAEVLRRTNWWRRMRGEEPIVLDSIKEPHDMPIIPLGSILPGQDRGAMPSQSGYLRAR